MAPIAVLYPAGPLGAGPVFNALGFSGCVAIVLGVRMNRPTARWGRYLIAPYAHNTALHLERGWSRSATRSATS